MKKLFKEEKHASPNRKKRIDLIPILFFAFQSFLPGQSFVNGFLMYDEFETLPGSFKIYSTFIDGDDKNDFIVLAHDPYAALHLSTEEMKYKAVKLPFPLTDVKKLSNDGESINCLFISRNDKSAGIIRFYLDGRYNITDKIKFDSFPGECSIYKRGPKIFALVYGENFNGLDLLIAENQKLEKINIVDKTLVGNAAFNDFDYDGYIDIVYLDLLTDEIKFLANNMAGGFDFSRSLSFDKTLKSFITTDFNYDGYFDLICNFSGMLEVSYGDSVSAFEMKDVLINGEITDFAVSDFNNDGYFDIAVHSDERISVYFSSRDKVLGEPVRYIHDSGITDLEKVDLYPKSLAVLTGGKIKLINNDFSGIRSQFLKLGLNPQFIFSYENKFSDTDGLFLINHLDQSLCFMTGGFSDVYTFKLSDSFNELRYSENGKGEIFISLFAARKRAMELIRLNMTTGEYKTDLLYSEILIDDIILRKNETSGRPDLFIVSNDNGTLSYLEFYYKDFRYLSSNPVKISDGVSATSVNSNMIIFYLKEGERSLYGFDLNNSSNYKYDLQAGGRKINTIGLSSFSNKRQENIVFFNYEGGLLYFYREKFRKVKDSDIIGNDVKKIYFSNDRTNVSFVYVLTSNGDLYKAGPLENTRNNLTVGKLAENVDENFFIDFTQRNNELIYQLNTEKDYIELRWLDEKE